MTSTREFVSLSIAVLTVSDTRDETNDRSGACLVEKLQEAGHTLASRAILADDVYRIRAAVAGWIADPGIHVVLITGGTGFAERDVTPEAVRLLIEQPVDGFGELFRALSYEEIGSSTIQSRAFAGLANRTLIFSMPGSPRACRLAWERIVESQLDGRNRPCNFIQALFPAGSSCHLEGKAG